MKFKELERIIRYTLQLVVFGSYYTRVIRSQVIGIQTENYRNLPEC